MSRPVKCRKICHFPVVQEFLPVTDAQDKEGIILTLDEYEAIRLIDKEGYDQEACSQFMQIARTSVQRIYENGRKKLADCIVDGRPLFIQGGDFRLCRGQDISCHQDHCFKQHYCKHYQKPKGDHMMRVAVTYENGQIFQHFGHTEQFKIYDIEEGKIITSEVISTQGSGHGALAGVLTALHADVLICGGIGGGAQAALTAAGIRWFGGVSGDADQAVSAFIAGSLEYNPDVRCSHHDHEHGEGHTCGSHGCGSHNCGSH